MEDQLHACAPSIAALQSSAAGPPRGSSGDWGSALASRAPRVRARLTRIEKVHVRRDDRPSNLARS